MENSYSKIHHFHSKEIYQKVFNNIQKVIKGQSAAIRKLLSAFASGGHVLLEDYPGTGKTTLAKALAYSVDGIEAPGESSVACFFGNPGVPCDFLWTATQAQRDHKIIHARNFHVQPQAIMGSRIVD